MAAERWLRSASAAATRSFSRAAPRSSPMRQLSQWAQERKPSSHGGGRTRAGNTAARRWQPGCAPTARRCGHRADPGPATLRAGGAALSATASVVVSLAPGASRAVVAAVAAGSVVAGSGHAAGVGGRGSVLVSGAMPPWYTRNSVPPCRPWTRRWSASGFAGQTRTRQVESALPRAETRAEQAGVGDVARSRAQNRVNPLRPSPSDFLDFFSGAWPAANASLTVRSRKSWHE